MLPLIQEFSAGYERIELQVISEPDSPPRIQRSLYEHLANRGAETEPVIMRDYESGTHFAVTPADDVRTDQLVVSEELFDTIDPWLEGSIQDLHIAKPTYASQLLWLGQTKQLSFQNAPQPVLPEFSE